MGLTPDAHFLNTGIVAAAASQRRLPGDAIASLLQQVGVAMCLKCIFACVVSPYGVLGAYGYGMVSLSVDFPFLYL